VRIELCAAENAHEPQAAAEPPTPLLAVAAEDDDQPAARSPRSGDGVFRRCLESVFELERGSTGLNALDGVRELAQRQRTASAARASSCRASERSSSVSAAPPDASALGVASISVLVPLALLRR
jgi:hypothetical protein